MSLARVFRIKERASVQIRAEFTNIFNRTEMNNPTATNPLATQTTTRPVKPRQASDTLTMALPLARHGGPNRGAFPILKTARRVNSARPRRGVEHGKSPARQKL